MNREELIKKIMQKKEFSELPEKDIEIIYNKFDKDVYSDEEKVKKTRDVLRKIYSVFSSGKLLNTKISERKTPEEILKKHISTRERFIFYGDLYEKILGKVETDEISVIDLGAGVNGLSYNFFPKNKKINYVGVEAVGQLADLMNFYFNKNNLKNFLALRGSLFDLTLIKNILKKEKGFKVVFLFKVIDSLEMVERNYSKKLLKEIVPLSDKVVVSFATRSLVSGKKFDVKRYWFENFVKENFNLIDEFFLGSEKYFVFGNR